MISDTIRTKPSIADNIALDLRTKIEGGVYPLGSRLPDRRSLAARYSVAPLTIQKAISSLEAAGLIESENGRGTFVARSTPVVRKSLGTVGIVMYVYESWQGAGIRTEKGTMIMQVAERAVSAAGGSSVFCNRYRQDGNHLSILEAVEDVVAQGADSVVFVLEQNEAGFAEMAAAGLPKIPMVSSVWDECDLPVPIVYYDSEDAGRSAALHLIECGCKNLMFFSTGISTWAEHRIAGAQEAVRASGDDIQLDIQIRRDRVIPNNLVEVKYEEEAAIWSREVLESARPFDGVIAANDRVAAVFAEEARARGLVAGQDFALIGFDNDHESRMAGLSTMEPPWLQMGRESVQLLERITQEPSQTGNVRLRSHLITRKSSGLCFSRR